MDIEKSDVTIPIQITNSTSAGSLKIPKKMSTCRLFSATVKWVLLVGFVVFLVASLTIDSFKSHELWGLQLWKWFVLPLVVFCGGLFARWMIHIAVFLISGKIFRYEKVLYFVYGVRSGVVFSMWMVLVLSAWILLFDNDGGRRPKKATNILSFIRKVLACCVVSALIWLLKCVSVKILASKVQGKRFFDRIRAAMIYQHILEVLPSRLHEHVPKGNSYMLWCMKASAWSFKCFPDDISAITSGKNDDEMKDRRIKTATEVADEIFEKFGKENENDCVKKDDLLRYFHGEMLEELFEGKAEDGETSKSDFKKWLEHIYHERDSLTCTLKDSKTAIKELNRLLSVIVLIMIIILWLISLGVLTKKILLFLCSQFLIAAYIFGNTVKTTFEAIIFVFVVHPFDVNDCCVIDGEEMIVEEMNLLTTAFLKHDNELIYYPNSVLATKPISNFYRSVKNMGDSVELVVDASTTVIQLRALEEKLIAYISSRDEYSDPSVVVEDFDDVNKIKIGLYFTHKIGFRNYVDKKKRRSEVVLKLKEILEILHIKFHILPQEAQPDG